MIKQKELPKKNEEIIILKTEFGDIKIRLFPEYAPKAVENFKEHSKNNYYNGLKFHRVIDGFMIQGGDPLGTGIGGESIWGHSFEDEFTKELHNIRGALCMANSGPNTNGSQFFIVQAKNVSEDFVRQMKGLSEYFPSEFCDEYEKNGGTPWLDYHHTVFGQVFDGMDIIDKIAQVSVDENSKPIDDVIIKKCEVVNY